MNDELPPEPARRTVRVRGHAAARSLLVVAAALSVVAALLSPAPAAQAAPAAPVADAAPASLRPALSITPAASTTAASDSLSPAPDAHAVAALVAAEAAAVTAQASGFSDVADTSVHQPAVEALAGDGVFDGTECGQGLFCPGEPILRWVMAVWLVRVLDGADPAADSSRFDDVDAAQWWSPYVERLADLGVTQGCSTEPVRFCPHSAVTRAQMASFLVRAFDLSTGPPAGFTDVNADSVHYANINALAESGVTQGCATDEFCPRRDTTRAQMATFLHRGSRWAVDREAVAVAASVALGALPDTATVAASARQIQVSWPEAAAVAGSPMAGYEVQWRSGGQGWDLERRRVVVELSYVIGGLDDGVTYTIRVRPAAVETAEVTGASIIAGEGSAPTAEIVEAPAEVDESLEISTLDGPVRFMMGDGPVWPAAVSVPIDTERLSAGRALFLMYYYEPLNLWLPVPGAVFDAEASTVSAQVEFTGTFTAIAGRSVPSLTDSQIGAIGEAVRAVAAGQSAPGNAAFDLFNGEPEAVRALDPVQVPQYARAVLDASAELPDGTFPDWVLVLFAVVAEAGSPDAPASPRSPSVSSVELRTLQPGRGSAGSALLAALAVGYESLLAAIRLPDLPDLEDAASWLYYQGQDKLAGNRGDAPQCQRSLPLWISEIIVTEDRNAPVLVCGEEVGDSLHLKIASNRGYPMRADVGFSFEIVDSGFNHTYGQALAEVLATNDAIYLPGAAGGSPRRHERTITLRIPHENRTNDEQLRINFYPDPLALFLKELINLNAAGGGVPPSVAQAVWICVLPLYLAIDHTIKNIRSLTLPKEIAYLEARLENATKYWITCLESEYDPDYLADTQGFISTVIDHATGLNLMAFLQTGVSMSSNFLDIYADEGGALVAVSIDGEAVPGTGPDQYAEPFSPIAAGDAHTCALGDLDPYYLRYTGVESRTVSCWGDNRHGQTNAPSLIIPSFTAVAAGVYHSCALETKGTITCWGLNDRGQAYPPASNDFKGLTSGDLHTCALRTDNTITCWGDNSSGQADAPGGEFVAVSAGGTHSCAVRTNGTISCWGRILPKQPGGASKRTFNAVSSGDAHSCGLRTDDTITCWGGGTIFWGEAVAPAGTFTAVTAYGDSACGLRTNGDIACWGKLTQPEPHFEIAAEHKGPFDAVTLGRLHMCARRMKGAQPPQVTDGSIWCDGNNDRGQTDPPGADDDNTQPDDTTNDTTQSPSHTLDLFGSGGHGCTIRTNGTVTCWGGLIFSGEADAPAGTFTTISTGGGYACGLITNGSITCWGYNGQGQTEAPAGSYRAISASSSHTCAIRTNGTITCWGVRNEGSRPFYAGTDIPAGTFTSISVGLTGACAIRTNNTLTCWGETRLVDAPAGTFTAISVGLFHACAIRTNSTLTCWGSHYSLTSDGPAGNYTAISAGFVYTCAIRTDNTITCWGVGNRDSYAPTGSYKAISVGDYTCATRTDNTITCWANFGFTEPDQSNRQFVPSGMDGRTVTVAQGGPGPTEVGPGQGIPCGPNTPTCRYLDVELRNFAPGTYTVSCSHDGWGDFGPSTFWTFSITVDANGSASSSGPCFLNFARLTGNGAYVTVSKAGTDTVRSRKLGLSWTAP